MMVFKIPTLVKRFSKRKKKQSLNKTHYGVMYAVMNEDESCLVTAIKAGAPLNSRIDLEDTSVTGDLDSKTPLHWVASRGNVNFLKLLLQAGADPNVKGTWSGRTPLLECSDNIECTRLLLAAGADVNTQDTDGNTVLHYAAATDSFSYLQYRFLLQCGGNVNVSNRLGETPLHKLCSYTNDTVQRAKAAFLSISNGCNVNEIDYTGRTALHLAASHCNEECVQMLIKGGAVVDAADYDGMTPLHFASRRRNGEGCVATLLNAGAEPDYENTSCGYTALQLAVQHNNVASVRLLLHYGARPFLFHKLNNEICRKSCCVRHISCHNGSLRQDHDPSLRTASAIIINNAIGTVPSLQSLCRLKIRRMAGPTRLHKLLELRQFPNSGYLLNYGNKQTNIHTDTFLTTLPSLKRKTSCVTKRLALSNENLDSVQKYENSIPSRSSTSLYTVTSNHNIHKPDFKTGTMNDKTELKKGIRSATSNCGMLGMSTTEVHFLPAPIRRYLLHCDEYDHWWDLRRKNKIFAIAAAGSARYQ